MEAIKRDVLQSMIDDGTPEGQASRQDLWEQTMSDANGRNRSVWNEQHGGVARGGLSNGMRGEEAKVYERTLRDDAERRIVQSLMDAGLIREDKMEPEVMELLKTIGSRQALFEESDIDVDDPEIFNELPNEEVDEYSLWDVIEILKNLSDTQENKKTNKKESLTYERFIS